MKGGLGENWSWDIDLGRQYLLQLIQDLILVNHDIILVMIYIVGYILNISYIERINLNMISNQYKEIKNITVVLNFLRD